MIPIGLLFQDDAQSPEDIAGSSSANDYTNVISRVGGRATLRMQSDDGDSSGQEGTPGDRPRFRRPHPGRNRTRLRISGRRRRPGMSGGGAHGEAEHVRINNAFLN